MSVLTLTARENTTSGRCVTPTSPLPSAGVSETRVKGASASTVSARVSAVLLPAASRAVTVRVWLPTPRLLKSSAVLKPPLPASKLKPRLLPPSKL